MLAFIVIANFADIDYLFGFLVGKPNLYHHQFTHSIGFTIIIAAGLAYFLKLRNLANFTRTFLIILATYGSHILVDFFTKDTSLPYGEQLFLPFSREYFLSSFSIFRDIHKATTSGEFFLALFSSYNLYTVLTEIMIFASLLILTYLIKNKFNIEEAKITGGNKM